jgi:hypothetical protein
MLLLLLFLAAVPIVTYRFARKHYPSRALLIAGIALGSVISPLSLGLYATFFIPYVGLVPGILGLMLTMLHSTPGYGVAVALGLTPSGQVVEGASHLYLAAINGAFWASIYGGLGWVADRYRTKK